MIQIRQQSVSVDHVNATIPLQETARNVLVHQFQLPIVQCMVDGLIGQDGRLVQRLAVRIKMSFS